MLEMPLYEKKTPPLPCFAPLPPHQALCGGQLVIDGERVVRRASRGGAPIAPADALAARRSRLGARRSARARAPDYSSLQYISPTGVANLKHYKYTGKDLSFFGNLFLFRLHGSMVELFPTWVA